MWWKASRILLSLVLFVLSGEAVVASHPSADLTGDGFVNFEDLAVVADQWLTGEPNIPDGMVYIPHGGFEMGDHYGEGAADELPLHPVLIDGFFMGKYEVTNQQYCDYLNSDYPAQLKVVVGVVYASSDGGNSYPYCDTNSADDYGAYSQIDYNDVSGTFGVRSKGGRDMADDPMVQVSWYGAAAYCNWRSSEEGYESCYDLSTWECNFSKHGYRLPTEAEWEYAGRGGLSGKRFPWSSPNISHRRANYYAKPGIFPYDRNATSGFHPDCNDGIHPYTSVVGSFAANGYGLYDMAGNVFEWCNDWDDPNYYNTGEYDNPVGPASGTFRVVRGGCWDRGAYLCRVASGLSRIPPHRRPALGFRVVLDLE